LSFQLYYCYVFFVYIYKGVGVKEESESACKCQALLELTEGKFSGAMAWLANI
jgi:hypothetical protein